MVKPKLTPLPRPRCLEVHRVGALPLLIECIRPDRVLLAADGSWSRPTASDRPRQFGEASGLRIINSPRDPPALYLEWTFYDHNGKRPTVIHFIVGPPDSATAPMIDGVESKLTGTLKRGEVLRWMDFVVLVTEVPWPSEEEVAMAEAARTNDSALQVYADWLENNGNPQAAEWARLVLADPATSAARMADLGTRVGQSFRALVARGPIERCHQRCKQGWEQLQFERLPWKRTCTRCQESVSWSEDPTRMRHGGPVVLDPSAPRTPHDLFPPQSVKG